MMMNLPVGAACAATIAAVVFDVRERRIPNVVTLPLIAFGPIFALLAGGIPAFGHAIELLALLLVGGVVVHRTGWLGGGDIKLAIGVADALGYPNAVTFLFATAVAGGVLALGIALARRRGSMLAGQVRSALTIGAMGSAGVSPIEATPADQRVPYALALAAGLIFTLLLSALGPPRGFH